MKVINSNTVIEAVRNLCIEANHHLPQDVLNALRESREKEESPLGKEILGHLLMNAEISRGEMIPLCQDTGFAVFFVELGQEVLISGMPLTEAIAEGVRQGYMEGFLRKSIVEDPIRRKNTGDNTPPIIHITAARGNKLRLVFAPKGGGSENMSRIAMLKPAEGEKGIKDFVVETVRLAGSNPCPPVVVGVGIGGNFEYSAILAKKALIREIGSRHPDPFYTKMEEELLSLVNDTGIGPQGLGGRVTALAVHIEVYPCHIASMPCAVNIQCHSARHKEAVL